MSIKVTVKDTEEGKRLAKLLPKLRTKVARVGVESGDATEPNGVDTALVAAMLEYGTSKMQPRPFMTKTYDDYQQEIEKDLETALGYILEGDDIETALGIVGKNGVEYMRNTIMSGDFIEPMNGGYPLIDSGTLLESINYKIKDRGDE